MLQYQSVESEHPLLCPGCKAPVYLVHSTTTDTPGGTAWLADGDCVPGVVDHLPAEQLGTGAVECLLSVGTCPSCSSGYFVVEAAFVQGPQERIYDWLAGAFEQVSQRNYTCRGPDGGEPWVLLATQNNAGPAALHIHGPFPADVAQLRGPNGVSACGDAASLGPWGYAKTLLLERWPAMRSINAAVAELG